MVVIYDVYRGQRVIYHSNCDVGCGIDNSFHAMNVVGNITTRARAPMSIAQPEFLFAYESFM